MSDHCEFCNGKGETDYFNEAWGACLHCEGTGECGCEECLKLAQDSAEGERADRAYDERIENELQKARSDNSGS